MNQIYLKTLLQDIKNGHISVEEAFKKLKHLPFEDVGYAKIDHHRQIRQQYPEVIYCEGKTVDQVEQIVIRLSANGTCVLGTRANDQVLEMVSRQFPEAVINNIARCFVVNKTKERRGTGKILVVTAGTADIPVAEEAAFTAQVFGHQTEKIFDVGVAGIHRLFAHIDRIHQANVIIVVAGMEGALASVVGGLTDRPVVAVPTSVGYGANFNGLSALLTMLNSCASGIGVVNIDNGFGAARLAIAINDGFPAKEEA